MQTLRFLAPKALTFLEALTPLWSASSSPVYLIGNNSLADALATAAAQQSVPLHRSAVVPPVDVTHPLLLIFTETAGEALGRELLACADLTDVTIFAPITDRHFSQKPLFLISIPKAGTHLVYELATALGYHAGVEPPEFPLGQHWYCVEYCNSHTVARDFFVDTVRRSPFGNRHHAFRRSPALFIYRHPLDILVSEAHYYHKDGKTAFGGWLSTLTFEQRIERLLGDNWLLGSLRDRIGGFLPWKDFSNVISLSFEELIGAAGGGSEAAQLQLIWSIQLKLQAPGNPREIAKRIFNPDSATFRAGQLGTYKEAVSDTVVKRFVEANQDILRALGYWDGGMTDFPVDCQIRRRAPLVCAQVDFARVPLLLESNFMGCNLVRYAQRIYAIPFAAGPIALSELTETTLSALPCASSLAELKLKLTLESASLAGRRQALDKIGVALRDNASASHPGEPLRNIAAAAQRDWQTAAQDAQLALLLNSPMTSASEGQVLRILVEQLAACRAELTRHRQMIDTLQRSIAVRVLRAIARWLRMKPHKVQE